MPMNPNFLCCIGAELKNSTQQTTRMSQVYLYRAFEDDTLSDMLSAGFFNAAMGIIRQDDLLLLYSPNETTAKYTYARVSSVSSSGVVIERIGIEATQIIVDTTGFSNLSGNNLQEILNNIDTTITTINDTFVRKDGSSIMSAPLKFIAGSFRGAVGPYLNGVEFYNVSSDGALGSAIARLTSTNGLTPNTDNVLDIGAATKRFKDLYIARIITGVINNGYDIAVPVTNGPDTLALKSEVDTAANSGRMITDQGVWFAKMYAGTTPPAADDGTNYADFSQTDGDGNPIIVIYERQSGVWVQSQTIIPPANYDGYVPVTKKIWDIVEQTGQNGGRILWNHQSKEFTPYPNIVSFEDIEVTGDSTVEMPLNPVPQQIVNKDYVDSAVANSGSGLNVGDIFLTMRNDNELNGAVECDGATYNTTDFTGDDSIGELLEAGKLNYVSLSAYSTAISTKGWCDKIGWNGTGNTQFRVPTLNAYVWQKLQTGVVGTGVLKFQNGSYLNSHNESLGVNAGWVKTKNSSGGWSSQGDLAVSSDPSVSNLVAGTSTDISQQRVMIQLATSATDQALETCTSVLADVAALKYDYIVDFQAPTAENNYTWYRKYASGWVEQGGLLNISGTAGGTVVLPVTMSTSYYNIFIQTAISGTQSVIYTNRTTTGFDYSGNVGKDSWLVYGMAAQ